MTEENRNLELQRALDAAAGSKTNVVRVADSLFDRVQARQGLMGKNQSQMAKRSMLHDVPEEEIPSREPYIAALKEFRTRVANAVGALGSLVGVSNRARIENLTVILDFLARERRN